MSQAMNQHDREIAAIRKILHTGMKMLVELTATQKRIERNLRRLAKNLETLLLTAAAFPA